MKSAIIGTAGWSIPAKDRDAFPPTGTALQRYGQVLRGVEINSSFYRPHRASTWARWAANVPDHFRFSIKVPKTITHQAKLIDCAALTDQFVGDLAPLGEKLAVLLVQLPPKLGFSPSVAAAFFADLRAMTRASIACEPRNIGWFGAEADALLGRWGVARVAADPALDAAAALPGGWRGLTYRRLHGSPLTYRSPYSNEALEAVARLIEEETRNGAETWCMFDNTSGSAALGNALDLASKLASLVNQ
ncbi:DUF72 domain-containing protein [Sphingomonas sp.]|uniref:DUF72 domain-containing protein n=1 Tax=Sphingomonas sp. TaxID=28214 RepID=UPI0025FA46A0|nr:DUF72 domain-containing protein [Sphingomonas sp.]